VPFAHDQFDNADHVRRLGAAEVIVRPKYGGRAAAAALDRLLSESSYRRSSEKAGAAIRSENGASVAAAEIDKLLRR